VAGDLCASALREGSLQFAGVTMSLLDNRAMGMVMMGNMNPERLQQLTEAPRQHELQRCPHTENGFQPDHILHNKRKTDAVTTNAAMC
jgi:hypothetical protein